MENTPKVTIITAYYNRCEYLRQSIESLLIQSYKNIEIIVINDGSTDNTESELLKYRDPRLKIINKKNSGLTKSLIEVIDGVNDGFIAIHGSGDISHKNRIEVQVKKMIENDAILCGASCNNLNENDMRIFGQQRYRGGILERKDFMHSPPFTHGTAIFCINAYKKSGGYNSAYRMSQDWDLWIRLLKVGKVIHIDELLYDRVALSDGASFNSNKAFDQLCYKYCAINGYSDPEKIRSVLKGEDENAKKMIFLDLLNRAHKLNIIGQKENLKNIEKIIVEKFNYLPKKYLFMKFLINFSLKIDKENLFIGRVGELYIGAKRFFSR